MHIFKEEAGFASNCILAGSHSVWNVDSYSPLTIMAPIAKTLDMQFPFMLAVNEINE